VKASPFEDKPRWPGGPLICIVANLPAFPTKAAYNEFHEANGPGCKVLRVWLCKACKFFHADTVAPNPCGDSSGTGRSSK